MRGKPLVLKQLDNGCIIPLSHKLNNVSFGSACKWIREWKVQRLSETE